MSATLDHLRAVLAAQNIEVEWDAGGDAAAIAARMGDGSPQVRFVSADFNTSHFDPDTARALGLALIEAAGLALGAWGQANADRADDAEMEHAEENAARRAAIRTALGRRQTAPDIVGDAP